VARSIQSPPVLTQPPAPQFDLKASSSTGALSPTKPPGSPLKVESSAVTAAVMLDSPRKVPERGAAFVARGIPQMPHFRVLATPAEMKSLMQQGVAETPTFNGYMLKGKLNDYEQKLTKNIAERYAKADEKEKKALMRMSRQAGQGGGAIARINRATGGSTSGAGTNRTGSPSRNASQPGAAGARTSVAGNEGKPGKSSGAGREEDGPDAAAGSWTVALLLHRWRQEAMPRIHACLHKRYGLLKVDLVECLAVTRAWSHDEMGQSLQSLVAQMQG